MTVCNGCLIFLDILTTGSCKPVKADSSMLWQHLHGAACDTLGWNDNAIVFYFSYITLN